MKRIVSSIRRVAIGVGVPLDPTGSMLEFLHPADIKRRFRRTSDNPLEMLSRWRIELGFAGGFLAFALAAPTRTSIAIGLPFVVAGLGIRTWARGHLRRG